MYAAVYHFGPRWPRVERELVPAGFPEDRKVLADNFEMMAMKGEHFEAATTTDAGPRIVADDLYPPVAAMPTPPTSEIFEEPATYSVEFRPESPSIDQKQFKALARKIEREDLSLDEIENFSITP